jgi:hypothetical protein
MRADKAVDSISEIAEQSAIDASLLPALIAALNTLPLATKQAIKSLAIALSETSRRRLGKSAADSFEALWVNLESFFASVAVVTLHRSVLIRQLIDHLIPIALVLYHLLKGTAVIFCLGRSRFPIVHRGVWSARRKGRTSREQEVSRCATDA